MDLGDLEALEEEIGGLAPVYATNPIPWAGKGVERTISKIIGEDPELLKGEKTELVSLADLKSFQTTIDLNVVKEFQQEGLEGPIGTGYRFQGQVYLSDGNHRVAAARALGMTEAPLGILDLDLLRSK